MTAPTARQLAILEWMRAYQAEHSMPPTIREIGEHFGIRSLNGVHDHLVRLAKKGFVRSRGPAMSRGWVAADRVAPATTRDHDGTDGWRAGIEAAIRKVKYRQSLMPDFQTAGYKQALADVLLHLEAMLERNTESSTSSFQIVGPEVAA